MTAAERGDPPERATCHQPRRGGEDPVPSAPSDGDVTGQRPVGAHPPHGDALHSRDTSEAARSSESPRVLGRNSPPHGDAPNSVRWEESVSATSSGGRGGSSQSLADRLTALPPRPQASRTRGGQRRQGARLQALRFTQSQHQHRTRHTPTCLSLEVRTPSGRYQQRPSRRKRGAPSPMPQPPPCTRTANTHTPRQARC